jgi:hypothetical protein
MRGVGRAMHGAGGALVSLAAAAGILVGTRSVVALEVPGVRSLLRLDPMPRESLGLPWSSRVVWPVELQEAAVERMAGLLAALFLAAASVALLNAVVLLFEAGAARRREMAVRAAVGAGPGALLSLLGRQVRALLVTGLCLGLLLGLAFGGVLRATWPAALESVGWPGALAGLAPMLALLSALAAGAYLWTGFSVGTTPVLATHLRSGGRATPDRGDTFRRRILSAVQMGAAGAVALGATALASSAFAPDAGGRPDDVLSVQVTAAMGSPPDWPAVLAGIQGLEGVRTATLTSPGALVGLGVRDNATAQCGACYRGGLPLPFWGARVDHHAVGPSFFEASGLRVLEGRAFTLDDGPDAARVAVVNRTFANTAFEDGKPLGHLVRLGRDLDGWYEVVGVVEDQQVLVVGRDDLARSEVYVSALQHPLRHGEVLLRGDALSLEAASALLGTAGLDPGPARTVHAVWQEAAAPLLWSARVALVLALLTLTLTVYGVHTTALQITRRRTQELAVLRVLGAVDGRVLAHVLVGSARTALAGAAVALFFGTVLVALLRKAAGGVPALGPAAYVAMAVLLVGAAVLASARAGTEALAVSPAEALE